MKFLLDMPISPRVSEWLNHLGHNAIHARNIGLAQSPDALILKWAADDKRVLLTMDLDFPVILSMSRAQNPGVILFRMRHPTPDLIKLRLECLFKAYKETDFMSSMIVIEDDRIRVRKLPIR